MLIRNQVPTECKFFRVKYVSLNILDFQCLFIVSRDLAN